VFHPERGARTRSHETRTRSHDWICFGEESNSSRRVILKIELELNNLSSILSRSAVTPVFPSVLQCVTASARVSRLYLRAWHTHARTNTHCHTLQHTATVFVAVCCSMNAWHTHAHTNTHCNTLQHTAPYCNTLQHTTTVFVAVWCSMSAWHTHARTNTHCNTSR